jgi:hypothetical protein
MVLTRDEASRVSSLAGAYLKNGLSWARALEALNLTPPPVEASLSRLKALGRLLEAARPVLGEAMASADLPPPLREMGRALTREG